MRNNLVRCAERHTVAQSQQGDEHQERISATLTKWIYDADQSRATQPCIQEGGMRTDGVAATKELTLTTYLCTVLQLLPLQCQIWCPVSHPTGFVKAEWVGWARSKPDSGAAAYAGHRGSCSNRSARI